jgi:hypothetical protein
MSETQLRNVLAERDDALDQLRALKVQHDRAMAERGLHHDQVVASLKKSSDLIADQRDAAQKTLRSYAIEITRLVGERDLLLATAKAWADQGVRSHWSAKASLALFDLVREYTGRKHVLHTYARACSDVCYVLNSALGHTVDFNAVSRVPEGIADEIRYRVNEAAATALEKAGRAIEHAESGNVTTARTPVEIIRTMVEEVKAKGLVFL